MKTNRGVQRSDCKFLRKRTSLPLPSGLIRTEWLQHSPVVGLFFVCLVVRPSLADLHVIHPRFCITSTTTCMIPTFVSGYRVSSPLLSRTSKGTGYHLPCSSLYPLLSKRSINMSTSSGVPSVTTLKCDLENSSLEHLQQRIQTFVQNYGQMCRLYVAMAGGGGHFLSTLASTPGASRILLKGSILYDRESYRRFVRRTLPGEKFRYASVESSNYSSEAALHQALTLAAASDPAYGHHPTSNLANAVGIGAASALSSNDGTQKRSRAYVTVTTSDSVKVTLEACLAKTGDEATDRTRFDEDIFVAHCILNCLEYTLNVRKQMESIATNEDGTVHINESTTTERGDEICIKADLNQPVTTEEVLRTAGQLILDAKRESVLLLAKQKPNAPDQVDQVGPSDFQIINQTVLPPLSVVFPGSFHPPHTGHIQLAKAALNSTDCEIAWFELSLANADKPSMRIDDVVERLTAFLTLRDEMPTHWGILLTNAPLFKQKVDLLYALQVSRAYEDDRQEYLPPLHFVIGTDTLVRILNKKYYENSEDNMYAALRAMPCHFVVGGRLEQRKGAGSDSDKEPVYVSGQEHVDRLPKELKSKFSLLPDFRVDISSSEIRRNNSQGELVS